MAYEVLKDNYYRSSVGPLGLDLGIRYDAKTGDYELKEKNALGYDAVSGNAIFYKNGSYTSDAIKDPKLFVDGDPNKPTALAQQLSVDMRKKVYAVYQAKGGAAGKNVVNNTATPKHQNDPAGVNNSAAGTNAGIATAIPGTSGLAAPPGQGNIFDPMNLDFNSKTEERIFKDGRLLKYPIDILENQQDTLQITMYRYRPPTGNLFLSSPLSVGGVIDTIGNIVAPLAPSLGIGSKGGEIATKGLQRNSALKKVIATTILPIPSGIQDNNAIGWGDDSMNNLTAAVAGNIYDKPGRALGGNLALNFGSAIAETFGVKLDTGAIKQIGAIADAVGIKNLPDLLKNPQTRAAITSLISKSSGFEIPAETILARGFGIVPNSNMELLFQGPTLRSFGFNWRMSPRSKEEARNVKRIIRMFKQGSAPRKLNSQSGAGAASVFLGTPNVFKLSYKTGNKEISGLNKFKICALVNMSVVYAPDGKWTAYAEGQPVSIQMSLNFQEIEPVYESDYQEGVSSAFTGNLRLDNYSSVNPDDVGY
jgi:hypothetical protein